MLDTNLYKLNSIVSIIQLKQLFVLGKDKTILERELKWKTVPLELK